MTTRFKITFALYILALVVFAIRPVLDAQTFTEDFNLETVSPDWEQTRGEWWIEEDELVSEINGRITYTGLTLEAPFRIELDAEITNWAGITFHQHPDTTVSNYYGFRIWPGNETQSPRYQQWRHVNNAGTVLIDQNIDSQPLTGETLRFFVESQVEGQFRIGAYRLDESGEPEEESLFENTFSDDTHTGGHAVIHNWSVSPFVGKRFFLTLEPELENPPVTYAEWAANNEIPENRRDPLDNPAGDGIPNVAKFAFGLDPNRATREGLPALERVGRPTRIFQQPIRFFVQSDSSGEFEIGALRLDGDGQPGEVLFSETFSDGTHSGGHAAIHNWLAGARMEISRFLVALDPDAPGGPSEMFVDDFKRPDSTDIGPNWELAGGVAHFEIQDEMLVTEINGRLVYTGITLAAPFRIEMDASVSHHAGITFHHQTGAPQSNYYGYRVRPERGTTEGVINLLRFVDGSLDTLVDDPLDENIVPTEFYSLLSRQATNAVGISMSIEAASDLAEWQVLDSPPESAGVSGETAIVRFFDSVPAADTEKRFLRLRIELED